MYKERIIKSLQQAQDDIFVLNPHSNKYCKVCAINKKIENLIDEIKRMK
jgi:hypothetical protein